MRSAWGQLLCTRSPSKCDDFPQRNSFSRQLCLHGFTKLTRVLSSNSRQRFLIPQHLGTLAIKSLRRRPQIIYSLPNTAEKGVPCGRESCRESIWRWATAPVLASIYASLLIAQAASASTYDLSPLMVSRPLEVDRALLEDLLLQETRKRVEAMPDEQLLVMVQQLLRSQAAGTVPPVLLAPQPINTRSDDALSTNSTLPEDVVEPGKASREVGVPLVLSQKQQQQQHTEQWQQQREDEPALTTQTRASMFAAALERKIQGVGLAAASVAADARQLINSWQGQQPQTELNEADSSAAPAPSNESLSEQFAGEQQRQEREMVEQQTRNQQDIDRLSKSSMTQEAASDARPPPQQSNAPTDEEPLTSDNRDLGDDQISAKDDAFGSDAFDFAAQYGGIGRAVQSPEGADTSQLQSGSDDPASSSNSDSKANLGLYQGAADTRLVAAALGVPGMLAIVLPLALQRVEINANADNTKLGIWQQLPDAFTSASQVLRPVQQKLLPSPPLPPEPPQQQQLYSQEAASVSSDGVLWRREEAQPDEFPEEYRLPPDDVHLESSQHIAANSSDGSSGYDGYSDMQPSQSQLRFQQLPSPWDDPGFYSQPIFFDTSAGNASFVSQTDSGGKMLSSSLPAPVNTLAGSNTEAAETESDKKRNGIDATGDRQHEALLDSNRPRNSSRLGANDGNGSRTAGRTADGHNRRPPRRVIDQAALLDNVEDDEELAAPNLAGLVGARPGTRRRLRRSGGGA